MSDKPPASFFSTLSEFGRSVFAGMPPGMLVICVLFGGLIWLFDSAGEKRNAAVLKQTETVGGLLATCLDRLGHSSRP